MNNILSLSLFNSAADNHIISREKEHYTRVTSCAFTRRSNDDHRLLEYSPPTPNTRANIREHSTPSRRERGVEVMATDRDCRTATLARVAGQR